MPDHVVNVLFVCTGNSARSIIYAAQFDGLRQLITFLMEDCCQGRAEICGGLVPKEQAACGPSACAPQPKAARSLAHATSTKRK